MSHALPFQTPGMPTWIGWTVLCSALWLTGMPPKAIPSLLLEQQTPPQQQGKQSSGPQSELLVQGR